MAKDGKAVELLDGPNADAMAAIQNRINDLVLELEAVKKGKGEASEIKLLRDELTDAQKELAAIKKGSRMSAADEIGGTDNLPAAEESGDYLYGNW